MLGHGVLGMKVMTLTNAGYVEAREVFLAHCRQAMRIMVIWREMAKLQNPQGFLPARARTKVSQPFLQLC